jgi:hypothetical protein
MLNRKRKLNSTLLPEIPLLVELLVEPDVGPVLEAAANVKVVSFLFAP